MRLLIWVFLGLASLAGSPSFARDWYVTPDGNGDVPTIQAAIDSSRNGDNVVLANGTYTGHGNRDIDYRGKPIMVRSESGDPRLCIIDCQGSAADPHRGFYFHSGEDGASILEGVTVRNGYAPLGGPVEYAWDPRGLATTLRSVARLFETRPSVSKAKARWNAATTQVETGNRGAISEIIETLHWAMGEMRTQNTAFSEPSSDSRSRPWQDQAPGVPMRDEDLLCSLERLILALKDVVAIDPTTSSVGGAVLCVGSSPTFKACNFTANRATGGAAMFLYGNESRLIACNFSNNHGTALVVPFYASGETKLVDCNFTGNEGQGAQGSGGTFLRCSFSRNKGDGVYGAGGGTFEHCNFLDNEGYGLAESGGAAKRCTFSGNSFGGIGEWIVPTVTDCMFSNHPAKDTGRGRGIDCHFSSVSAVRCTFSNNARDGIFARSPIFITVRDCEFTGNARAGVYLYEGPGEVSHSRFVGNHSGIYCAAARIDIENSVFFGNTVRHPGYPYGGGLVVVYGSLCPSTVRVKKCTFSNNRGSRAGGADIYDSYHTTFEECSFVANSGTHGGGICFTPGTPWRPFPAIRLDRCLFSGNIAARGGALYCSGYGFEQTLDYNVSLSLANCTLFGNVAETGGAIFCQGFLPIDLKSTIIASSKLGEAIHCDDVTPRPALMCCDIYGNEGGDWVGPIADQLGIDGNFSLDPLFCDVAQNNLTLSPDSPCLPANNACGVLIGAVEESCFVTTAADPSWQASPGDNELRSLPNPFNPTTRISYALKTQSFVKLSVYDVSGRLVDRLIYQVQPAGKHFVQWDARGLPSGVYFCRLDIGGRIQTRKLILLR